MNEFSEKVYALIAQIPKGLVASYGQIAFLTGNPLASRAVGAAMRGCPDTLCWYRVVRADGSMVFEMQQALLEQEGVTFLPGGKVNMRKHAMKIQSPHSPPQPAEFKIGRYRHFKGGEYRLIALAKHSETLEDMVVYQALYGEGGIWVRPASMWNESVEHNGKTVSRFTYIGE